MSQALINRSLTNIRTELEFLYESNVITKSLYDNLISALPERYSGQPPVGLTDVASKGTGTPVSSNATGSHSPAPAQAPAAAPPSNPEALAEAMYDFQPQQPSDLKLTVGDKVVVLEKLSPDWWKGRVGSQEGVFPANYVRLLSAPHAPLPYQNTAASQSSSFQQQPPFPPASANYYPPQQQQQQQQQQAAPQASNNAHPHLKKFGKQLKDAAVFGAGATIGSDIVNSIF